MKFIELNKSLKNEIKHLYVLTGDDVFLLNSAVNLIKTATINNLEEFNFAKLDGTAITKSEFAAQLETLPIGNDYRMIVVDAPSNEVCLYLQKYQFEDFQVVVVKNAKLNAGEQVDCTKLDRADICKYIINFLTKRQMTIEEQALDYIIDATGGNMSKINNELLKIVSYLQWQTVVSINVATNLIANSSEYVSYMLTNAIDTKSYTDYQKILNTMSKSQTAGDIFAFLGKYFKRMQYIALNKDDAKLSSILAIKPYAIKMSRQNIAKNGTKFYISLYQKYVDLDYKIKSGKISAENALYELVF